MAALGPIKVGDIVEVDRKGRHFHAIVEAKTKGLLSKITPLQPGITYTTAKSHEVVKHWRLTKNTRK